MKLEIKIDDRQFNAALERAASQVPFAAAVAINRAAEPARAAVQARMRQVFDRPTPWVINSLRLKRATKQKLEARLWFKSGGSIDTEHMIAPHIYGGKREMKRTELRLQRAGLLPAGWQVVPGQGAKVDGFGNMNRGQISTLLNVLGTYTEAGYNKANAKTVSRLAKGTARNYGVVYWVNRVGSKTASHLLPGVYQRVNTPFGSSLKPVLIFVRGTTYRHRLDFFGIVEKVYAARFPVEFSRAFEAAMASRIARAQGGLFE